MASKEPIITEEPAPGWQRYETEGEKPYYKTPIPRTVIKNKVRLNDYITKQQAQNRMLDLSVKDFSFKRRLGLSEKKKSVPVSSLAEAASKSVQHDDVRHAPVTTLVERLTKNGATIDHKRLLVNSCKSKDGIRGNDAYDTPINFEEIRERLSGSTDLIDLLQSLNADRSVSEALDMMFADACLSEISRIDL